MLGKGGISVLQTAIFTVKFYYALIYEYANVCHINDM